MSLRTARIAIAALCALSAPALEATPSATPLQASEFVIDQDQPNFRLTIANLPPNASRTSVWQSFQQSSDVISGAGMFLFPGVGVSGRIRIELWNGPPVTGERLAFAGADGVAGTWADVFWAPQAAEPGRTYFLAFEGMGQGRDLALAGVADNPYPRGSVYLDGDAFPSFDATFRTFGPAIPEPASALLVLAGLAAVGVVGVLRRKRAAR